MQHFGRFRPITEIQTDPLPALDSRSTFRLRVDSTVVGENLTAAQAQLLVGDILERIALPNRDRIRREMGAAEDELEPSGVEMFHVAKTTTAWRIRLDCANRREVNFSSRCSQSGSFSVARRLCLSFLDNGKTRDQA
jgi:hypothetical protein